MISRRTTLKAATAGLVALTSGGTGLLRSSSATHAAAQVLPRRGPDAAGLQKILDDIATAAASAVLAEVRDSSQVWRGSSGVAELGSAKPVAVNGRFRAGSITKSFVATIVLQLVGEGRLRLDDTVEYWLPGVVAEGRRITVHHLLQHTSGIENYTNTRPFRTLYGTADQVLELRNRTWTPQELLNFTAGLGLLFEPGTSWMYSNTNYILLGLVIQRVTGNHYAEEAERRILRRLRLHGTQFPGRRSVIAGPHAHGYLPRETGGLIEPVDITRFNPSVTGASGELVSTAADLNLFYRALLTGSLLGVEQQRQLLQIQTTGRSYDYGLGLETRLVNGIRLWGHDGDIFGYQTASWTTEDGRRQLTVAYNPWGGDLKPFTEQLLAVAFRAS
ncbi:serine hydrolase domain-containing protein [Kribbella speibonae]|uniref:Class A beta-lactamase-related serine hydrolase n=1 Tax=Kribbella speibonae TaxID=1572660 RepID=A0A4R0ID70_9ACTN|nr:serine hydrolase domain-containing protein [Kribbella speibonae]TCC29106.1 class A beta-lactamase-related serine hydrolase [Kribbella speibonae]